MSRANRSGEWHLLFRVSETLADPILVVPPGWLKNAASKSCRPTKLRDGTALDTPLMPPASPALQKHIAIAHPGNAQPNS
jgi:hypothetical protein